MDKFNNSNSTLALQKFYNQNNNGRLFELQQRLKTEQIVCQIEIKKLINEKKLEDKEEVINEEEVIIEEEVINEEKVIIEEQSEQEQNQEEPLSGEPGSPTVFENTVSLEEIYYQSNENFEIDKPTLCLKTQSGNPVTLERTKSTIINQTKINNLIKLKKW